MTPEGPSAIPPHLRAALASRPVRGAYLVRALELHLDGMLGAWGTPAPAAQDIPAFVSEFRHQWQQLGADRLTSARVEHVLRKAELQLAAHAIDQGRDASVVVDEYRSFVSEHAGLLFDSLFEWIQSAIDDDLYAAQHFHFNTLSFESVSSALERHRRTYLDVLGVIKLHDLDDLHTRDALLAQLTGTLGQALGFLASMPGFEAAAEQHRAEAARLLVEDIGMLHRGSDLWIQGVNYLVALHWNAGAFDLALRWFAESLQRKQALFADGLQLLAGPQALVPADHSQHRWLFLNQLRLAALGIRQGRLKIDGKTIETALELYCGLPQLNYPDNLAVKWLLVLAGAIEPGSSTMLPRIRELLGTARGAPILELMRAVELTLLAALSPRDQAYALSHANRILDQVKPFGRFAEFLDRSSWAAAVRRGGIPDSDLYGIAVTLPFYYA